MPSNDRPGDVGSRTMRNELTAPRRPARTGTRSATWSERFLASVLMARISSWTAGGSSASCAFELGVAHDLGIGLEHLGDLLLLAGGITVLDSVMSVKPSAERREHDAAGHREAERQAERAGGGVHARRLADPFLGDRGEREVVELGHEEAEPEPAMSSGTTRYQPESTRGTSGMIAAIPTVASTKPASTMCARAAVAALRRRAGPRRTCDSDSGASERPASIALYSSVICRNSGRTIIAPPSVICWSICWEMPMRKFGCAEQVGVEQRRLAVRACVRTSQ